MTATPPAAIARLPFAPIAPGTSRHVRPALFGRYSRYQAGLYLQHAGIVAFGLLTIALTIDLAQWLPRLIADPRAGSGVSVLLFVLRYLALRTPDILVRLLPIACFLGVLWCELTTIAARHRVALWITGRSPLQCLMPALLLGLVAGCGQYLLETAIRPAVVAIQATERIGEFGNRFDRARTTGHDWMFVGRDAVRARLVRQPSLELRDLLVLRSDAEGRIVEVVSADRAVPLDNGIWRLEAGVSLPMEGTLPRGKSDRHGIFGPNSAATGLPVARIPLDLDLEWLDQRGVTAKYLPQATLEVLARGDGSSYPVGDYRTARETRRAALILPLAMALLAAVLTLVALPNRIRVETALAVAFAGYACHIALRALASLGERGIVAAPVAAWGVPVAAILAALAVLAASARASRHRRPISAGAATPAPSPVDNPAP